jgi:hypothetical protein
MQAMSAVIAKEPMRRHVEQGVAWYNVPDLIPEPFKDMASMMIAMNNKPQFLEGWSSLLGNACGNSVYEHFTRVNNDLGMQERCSLNQRIYPMQPPFLSAVVHYGNNSENPNYPGLSIRCLRKETPRSVKQPNFPIMEMSFNEKVGGTASTSNFEKLLT